MRSNQASPSAEIVGASEGDLSSAAQLLASALRDDASLGTFVSGRSVERRRAVHLQAEARSIVAGGGRVDLCRGRGGTLLGASVWEGPEFRETVSQTLRFGPAMLMAVRVRGLRNWLRYRGEFARYRPAKPYWHLVRIGTDAAVRGQGLGSALIEARLAEIDARGEIAHLEASSADGARLYGRLGFEVVGEIRLQGATRLFAMTRPQRG